MLQDAGFTDIERLGVTGHDSSTETYGALLRARRDAARLSPGA